MAQAYCTFLTLPRFDKVLYNMIFIHQFTQTHARAALSIILYHKKINFHYPKLLLFYSIITTRALCHHEELQLHMFTDCIMSL